MDLTKILDNKLDKDFLIQLFQEQEEVYYSAIELAITNKQPFAWRATWILKHCTSKNDIRITPYINDFIKAIAHKKEGHQREILNILLKMDLNETQEGRLFDICMSLWETIAKAPSVRYLAYKHIHKICESHPDLKSEIDFITQPHYLESLSPGIKKGILTLSKKNN